MDATADLDSAAQLDAWLKKHVAEPRRALARGAASNLSDYATCEEADLEDVLQISTWPPLARSRFLRAWRKLKGDEALTGTATVATQTDIVGAVPPAAAADDDDDDDDFGASSDDEDDDEGPPGVAPPKGVAMRRVGDAEWRIFATRSDAARAFPGVNASQVRRLARNDAPNAEVRRLYEARPLTADDPVPLASTTITSGKMACEMRRVGDKNWRWFESRSAAARAFPGLESRDVSDLINKPPTTKKSLLAVREMYEARNVVEGDDEQPPPSPRTPPISAAELAAADARPAAAAAAPQPKPPAPSPAPPAPVPPPRVVVTRKPMPAARPPAPPPKQKFVVRVPPPEASPAAAPQPKPSPAPPRPRTPPLEAFRKHAGPDGDRKAAVAAFFAAQSSDEAPPPKKRRADDAIGDGEVLSEMF